MDMLRSPSVRRVLFDFDGTLFDTQTLHAQVEAELCKQHGVIVSPDEITERFAGTSTKTTFETLLGCDPATAAALARTKWDIMFPRMCEARPLADLRRLFVILQALDVSIAIGTASPQKWARGILERNDLLSFFEQDSVVGGDMVAQGKPAPDIWLLAATHVDPSACLVVEDGVAGVEAARAAGMRACLLTPRTHGYASSISELADILRIIFG